MIDPAREVVLKTILLEQCRIALATQISDEALLSLQVETYPDFARAATNALATFNVWGERPDTAEHSWVDHHPATPWQHFKRRRFPDWALRRWPVRTLPVKRTIVFGLQRLYPQAPIALGPERYREVVEPGPVPDYFRS